MKDWTTFCRIIGITLTWTNCIKRALLGSKGITWGLVFWLRLSIRPTTREFRKTLRKPRISCSIKMKVTLKLCSRQMTGISLRRKRVQLKLLVLLANSKSRHLKLRSSIYRNCFKQTQEVPRSTTDL